MNSKRMCGKYCLCVMILIGFCVLSGCRSNSCEKWTLEPGEPMFRQVKVAAISFVPKKFDMEYNVNRLEETFRQAHEKGAELAVAPEGIIEGYVINQVLNDDNPPERLEAVSITIDGPVMKRFQNLAEELDMCLAFGYAELIDEQIYNAAVFIDNTGKICGTYYKMQFWEGYHPSWWFNRLGEHSRAFDTPFGRCGFLICNDRWTPSLARVPVLDGAQYLLIPSYGTRNLDQDETVLGRARENGVPIVQANVGVSLIISKGEIKQVVRADDAVVVDTIDIPASPSSRNRDIQEKAFLEWRKEEMNKRYKKLQQLKAEGKY